jgi:hypothetical protein
LSGQKWSERQSGRVRSAGEREPADLLDLRTADRVQAASGALPIDGRFDDVAGLVGRLRLEPAEPHSRAGVEGEREFFPEFAGKAGGIGLSASNLPPGSMKRRLPRLRTSSNASPVSSRRVRAKAATRIRVTGCL